MVPDEVVAAAEGFFKCRSIMKLFLIFKSILVVLNYIITDLIPFPKYQTNSLYLVSRTRKPTIPTYLVKQQQILFQPRRRRYNRVTFILKKSTWICAILVTGLKKIVKRSTFLFMIKA